MTEPRVLKTSGELIRSQAAVLFMLAIWAFLPLALLVIYVVRHGGTLTGANGTDAFDQLQYLAWIRDEGRHLLASNLWQVASSAHDYLHPMYFISGLLWRLGLGVQLAYLVWKPVALVVLFLGYALYVRHLLPGSRWRQAAALFLALFYITPALQLATWTGRLSLTHRLQLLVATNDADSALNLWGFDHAAITAGLMPVFLICAERIIDRARRASWTWTAIASAAGMLVSWLHPWQGVTLLAIVAIMVAVAPPRRRYVAVIIPMVATVLPLAYGVALTHFDPVWRAFQARTIGAGVGPWWALVIGFAPLVALAAFGVTRPRSDRTWMLLLWVVACALVFFLVPEFPPHALTGVTLPLAILAVLGWERLCALSRLRRAPAALLAVVCLAVFSVPGAIYEFNLTDGYTSTGPAGVLTRQLVILSPDQSAAMTYLARLPTPGAVMAPWYLSMSVPGQTGRRVFAGHQQWQPAANVRIAGALYSPFLRDPTGSFRRAILERAGTRFVIVDGSAPESLSRAIAPIATPVAHFGRLTIYRYTGR